MGRRSRDLHQRRVERERLQRRRERQRLDGERRGCLFCRQRDGGFNSQEHILPESLGNTEFILAQGVVCDRCNNQTLSTLDQVICDFTPISIRRTMLGVPSKADKVPRFRFSEGTMDFLPSVCGAEPTLQFRSNRPGGVIRETGRRPDGRVLLQWKFSGGRRLTARYASQLSRALLKAALECAWVDHGEMMLESRFDHIRQAVLGEPRAGFFLLANRLDPDFTGGSLTYELLPHEDGTWRMMVHACYLGIIVATDSRLPGPVGKTPEGVFTIITFDDIKRRAA